MGKRVGSPADRLFVYEQIEANSGQAGDSLCDRLRLDLKLKISNRSLRQWHRDTKKAIAKAKRNSVMEAIGSPSPLPRSIESDSDTTADSPQIDLTGKTQSEVLTLTIDTALARLVRLVSNNEPIAASTLTKIVSDLTDAYRKLLSIPQEVMDALGELGRLQGILQRTNAERPDSSPETLRSFFKAVCDHIEDDTKQLASGEGVVTSDRGTVRNPDWSSATIGELVEELLAVPIMWNEWIHVQSYIASRINSDRGQRHVAFEDLKIMDVSRDIRDALPELIDLERAINPQGRMTFNLRPAFVALAEHVKTNGLPAVAPVQATAETQPIKTIQISEEATPASASDEPEDLLNREAVVLAESELSRQRSEDLRQSAAKRKEARERIDWLKAQPGPLGTAWDLADKREKERLLREAGY